MIYASPIKGEEKRKGVYVSPIKGEGKRRKLFLIYLNEVSEWRKKKNLCLRSKATSLNFPRNEETEQR